MDHIGKTTTSNNAICIATDDAEAQILLSGGCIGAYRLKQPGGNTSSRGAMDLLRPLETHNDASADPLETACFPLIPYSGRIRNGCFQYGGKEYNVPLNFGEHPHNIHGIGWQTEWRLKEATGTQTTIDLEHDGSTDWPFPFLASQRFTMEGAGLRHEIALENTGNTPMPAGLGMHPYFPRHGKATLEAGVTSVWLTDETCLPTERVSCPPQWQLADNRDVDALECDNQFEPWSGRATINWPGQGLSLTLEASNDLDRLVVYAPKGESFFCVEPVSHMTDAFNLTAEGMSPEQTGMRTLEPGEVWQVWMHLTPSHLCDG